MSGSAAAGGGLRNAAVLVGIALLAILVFLPAVSGEFVSDDTVLIVGNPAVRSLGGALRAFGRSYWHGLKEVAPYYRPLVVLSYAADWRAAGLRPAAFHVTNLLIHAACCVLVALLVTVLAARARGDPAGVPCTGRAGGVAVGAALAGALAAVHPIHSEPVAAIYGRPDLLAAFFGLAFLNLALRGHRILAVLCLAAALLSKESAFGLPLLAPFAFAAGCRTSVSSEARGGRPGRTARRQALGGAAAAALLLGGYIALRYVALDTLHDARAVTRLDNPLTGAGAEARRLTPLAVAARYAGQWFWPARLCADWGFDVIPLAGRVSDPRVLAGAAVLLVSLLGLLHLAIRRSPWALVIAAAGLAYLPASNLLVLAPALMAERFAYVPSLCACVLLGGAWARLVSASGGGRGRAPGWLLGVAGLHALAAAVVLLAGVRTYFRAGDFKNDLSLYGSTVAACPSSAKAQYNLGNALARAGRDEEAIGAYEAAVDVAPWLAIAHANMGNSYLNLRRLREAEAAYRTAVEISPGLLYPRVSLAGILYLDGRLEEALQEARRALALNPPPSEAEQIVELIRRIESGLARKPAGPR